MEIAETSLSVVVVSDFEPASQKSWRDEIRLLRALAKQDLPQPFEVIVVESRVHRNEPAPPGMYKTVPNMRLEYCDANTSAAMKDHGVTLATGDWIAVIEADCTPEPDWLRLLLEAAIRNPEVDAVSGRTNYGEETSYKRVLNLLDRSFDDSGKSRECFSVSNNGAIYRATLLSAFPYQDAITPFLSARLRNRKMKQCGHRFYFERAALIRHEVGGLSFIHDYRMNRGYTQMKIENEQSIRRIPARVTKNLVSDLRRYRRLARLYLRWWDWPLGALLIFWVRIPEAIGMYFAVRNAPALPGTAYR